MLATQADGRTLVHDWMYGSTAFAPATQLLADLFLYDPHRHHQLGTPLRAGLDSRDIRSGMALIAAAAGAQASWLRSRQSSGVMCARRTPAIAVLRWRNVGGPPRAATRAARLAKGSGEFRRAGPVRRRGSKGYHPHGGLGRVGVGWSGCGNRWRRRGFRWLDVGSPTIGRLSSRPRDLGRSTSMRVRSRPTEGRRSSSPDQNPDVRRQREDDVGLLRLLVVAGEQVSMSGRSLSALECRRVVRSSSESGPRACSLAVSAGSSC